MDLGGEKRRDCLRFGVAGMGVGASSVLRPLSASPCSELAAGADINPRVRERFHRAYPHARLYDNVDALCADGGLDAIWISTPNKLHAEHAIKAARSGKHVIISKPMATSLREAEAIVQACEDNGVKLIAGHSLGFSPSIRAMARIAREGLRMGHVRAIQTMAFTDWMLLPRTAEEVDASQGGGLIHRQSPHQIDAVRVIGGGMVRSVRGFAGDWMSARKAPGFFSAFLEFENGVVATVSHNGYGYLVGPDLAPWGADAGISGHDAARRAASRRNLGDPAYDEESLKDDMRLGGASPLFQTSPERRPWMPLHLGVMVVTCDRGDMRHAPYGLFLHDDQGKTEFPVEDKGLLGLSEIEELHAAVRNGAPLYRDGVWGMATLEVAMAIMESSATHKEVRLRHQTPTREGAYALSSY